MLLEPLGDAEAAQLLAGLAGPVPLPRRPPAGSPGPPAATRCSSRSCWRPWSRRAGCAAATAWVAGDLADLGTRPASRRCSRPASTGWTGRAGGAGAGRHGRPGVRPERRGRAVAAVGPGGGPGPAARAGPPRAAPPGPGPPGRRPGTSSATCCSATPSTTRCPSRPGPSCTSCSPSGASGRRGPAARDRGDRRLPPGAGLALPGRAGHRRRAQPAPGRGGGPAPGLGRPPGAGPGRPAGRPNLLERAVGLLPAGDPGGLELLVELADMLVTTGEFARAEAVLGQVAAAAADAATSAGRPRRRARLRMAGGQRTGADAVQAQTGGPSRPSPVRGRAGPGQGVAAAGRARVPALPHRRGRGGRRPGHEPRPPGPRRTVGVLGLGLLAQAAFWGPTPPRPPGQELPPRPTAAAARS